MSRYDPSSDRFVLGKQSVGKAHQKWWGGVRIPDGRVVMAPSSAANVGLFLPNTSTPAYTVPTLPAAWNALLLPFYNKM